jgi:poly(A) polymerase
LARLLRLDAEPDGPDAMLRLAALVEVGAAHATGSADGIADRLRLSNAERRRLALLTEPPLPVTLDLSEHALRVACYRLGPETVRDLLHLAAARRGDTAEGLEPALAVTRAWQPCAFPLKGRDLLEMGAPKGPQLGDLLEQLESWWIAQDFEPDRAAVLAEAKARLDAA